MYSIYKWLLVQTIISCTATHCTACCEEYDDDDGFLQKTMSRIKSVDH